MKKSFWVLAAVFLMVALPIGLMAQDYLSDAKAQIELKNLDAYKKAVDLSVKAVQQQPQSYEANWVCAKAHRLYGNESMKQNATGWKQVCKEYGKKGMGYAEKAIALNRSKVDGHFWFGANVGTYADSVSVLTALKEGLKGKTQDGFENAYKIDKMYENGYPIKGLGRFWSVLPWPLTDKEKGLQYLEEYQKLFPNDVEGQVWLGEAYKNAKKKDKAKETLTKAVNSSDKFYANYARRLLSEL